MNALAARITAVNTIAEQLLQANPAGKDSIINTQKQLNHRWLEGGTRELREDTADGMAAREFCRAWNGGQKCGGKVVWKMLGVGE